MMLLFNLIKKDIKEGYEYFDYDSMKYRGYNVHTILDKEEVLYYITSETQQVTVHYERNEFLKLSYNQLAHRVTNNIYYNMVDKLED